MKPLPLPKGKARDQTAEAVIRRLYRLWRRNPERRERIYCAADANGKDCRADSPLACKVCVIVGLYRFATTSAADAAFEKLERISLDRYGLHPMLINLDKSPDRILAVLREALSEKGT